MHFLITLLAISAASSAQSQTEVSNFVRLNTFGVLSAYSNDSSPMLLGVSVNRKLLNVGVSYNRRLISNRIVNWQYSGEFFPIAFESDPVQVTVTTVTYTTPPLIFTTTSIIPTVTACHPQSGGGSIPQEGLTYSYVGTCSRRWTTGQALSPAGFQWNFLTRRRLQPFLIGHGGYMYSTKPIPVTTAGSFNFTFDFGAGIEFFRTRTQSVRGDFRYHHISNDWTAQQNPGVDSGVVQVTYTFGR
jgi:hypothetical protein